MKERLAGASLEHTHTQLIALPVIPKLVKEETDASRKYFDYKERCIFCDLINQELEDGKRLIYENAGYVALAPFASRSPFETWICPSHMNPISVRQKDDFSGFADILQKVLKQMDRILDIPPYNFLIHTSRFP